MEILGLLRLNRLSADSLIIELKQLFGPIESALERDQLIAYLHQFEAMGLIVSHYSCDSINSNRTQSRIECAVMVCASPSVLSW